MESELEVALAAIDGTEPSIDEHPLQPGVHLRWSFSRYLPYPRRGFLIERCLPWLGEFGGSWHAVATIKLPTADTSLPDRRARSIDEARARIERRLGGAFDGRYADLDYDTLIDALLPTWPRVDTGLDLPAPSGRGPRISQVMTEGWRAERPRTDHRRQADRQGIYTSSTGWIQGRGYVVVGNVKRVVASGEIVDPNRVLGAGNIASLNSATTFKLPDGECTVSAVLGEHPLTLTSASAQARFGGFLTGAGPLKIEGPLELTGAASHAFIGGTTLVRGTLRLNKSANAIAIPGNLTLGDAVIWDADGQIAPISNVTAQGNAVLDLNGHAAAFSVLHLSKTASVRTGAGGTLRVKQLFVDGARMIDGVYKSPQAWLAGTGSVTVDSRVDVKGVIGSPESAIGDGNIGNLVGDTKIGYPSGGGDFDIATNGRTLTLDSGDGNAFAWSGSLSGSGNVEFFMGPSYTGFRDAPMLLTGKKPNTLAGKFLLKKGRVQLEKPEGVDAISGDVIVGGQGFNDCLFWKSSHQIKDSATITLLDAGNNGAPAYLHLNGCQESAAGLVMTANNKVHTDSSNGVGGVLTVKSLILGGAAQPAGEYTTATAKWIEGKGRVIVKP